MSDAISRSSQLDRALADLLTQAPEVEAAAVVSFDGLPMASALPASMDEDRVAAMSAALLSLGERAAEGLGRGQLNQVYIEGDSGTVFLVSADDEAVLVAVAAKGAKVGMMLFEVRRAAEAVAAALRVDAPSYEAASYVEPSYVAPTHVESSYAEPVAAAPAQPVYTEPVTPAPVAAPVSAVADPVLPGYAPAASESSWPSYVANGNGAGEPANWS
jgi:predicted regulator of Ras-like GTPase activity (Roadblock/LC7/MglB family)